MLAGTWPEQTPELFFLLGICYSNLHKWDESLQSFNEALKLKPQMAEGYYRRGVVRFALKHSKAIEDIHRALAIDPTLFEAFITRALYFAQRKLYPMAIANCNEAIKLEPKCLRAFVYRGAFKFLHHNFRGAVEDLDSAVALDRRCVLALFNRACAHHMAANVKMALRDYSALLLLESQRGTCRVTYQTFVNRGLLYFSRSDFANALADFRSAAQLKPRDPSLVHALALCYHKFVVFSICFFFQNILIDLFNRKNHLKTSVLTYCRLINSHPNFQDGYIGRANALVDYNTEAARNYAMKELKRRLHLFPEQFESRINLAICLQMTGRLHLAYRQLTILIDNMAKKDDVAPSRMARARELRGVVSLQAQSFDASMQDFSMAIRLKPSAQLFNNRGICHWLMSDRQSAVADFKQALHFDQRFTLGYFNLANVYMIDKRWEQALDFYNRAILFGPDNETALINRAIVNCKFNKLSEAFTDLANARRSSPHAHHIAFNRSVLHRLVRKLQASLDDMNEAISYKPDDPQLYQFRSTIHGELGHKDQAMQDHTYAVDLANFLKDKQQQQTNKRDTQLVIS